MEHVSSPQGKGLWGARQCVQSAMTLQRASVPAGSGGSKPGHVDQAQKAEGRWGLPFGQAPGTQHSHQAYQIWNLWLYSYFWTPCASKATILCVLPALVQEGGGIFLQVEKHSWKGKQETVLMNTEWHPFCGANLKGGDMGREMEVKGMDVFLGLYSWPRLCWELQNYLLLGLY